MTQTKLYNVNGKMDFDVNNTVAKSVLDYETDKTRYLIKADRGRLFNPHGLFYRQGDMTRVVDGISKFTFISVTQEVFDLYLKFLSTKNESFIRLAERQLS